MESINGWYRFGYSLTLEDRFFWAEALHDENLFWTRDFYRGKSGIVIYKDGTVYSLWKKKKQR